MAKKRKESSSSELDATRHKDTRKNIPTEELRDFVAAEETKPPKMLYPRDPSLDPQLVWKGKDEQDREPLEVDVVPIYIQEVIEPRVIIDAIQSRKTTKPDNGGFLPGFFDDFDDDGVRPQSRVLPARPALGEPHDPGQLAARHDEPRREGRAQGQGSDDLHRPALWNQVSARIGRSRRESVT